MARVSGAGEGRQARVWGSQCERGKVQAVTKKAARRDVAGSVWAATDWTGLGVPVDGVVGERGPQ